MRTSLGLLLLSLPAATAVAAPSLTVRGHAALRIVGVYRTDTGATLVGELHDRDLQTGVSARPVEVLIGEGRRAHRLSTVTDESGRFSLSLPDTRQPYRIALRFVGDREYAAEIPAPQLVDADKANLDLELNLPHELDLARPRHLLRIHTRVATRSVSVPLTLRNARGRPLGEVTTDGEGQASFPIRMADADGPGRLTILVDFAGDDRINPRSGQVSTLLVTSVHLALRVSESQVPADGGIHLAGEVTDARGPVAEEAVNLSVMGRHAASTLTDGSGRFSFQLAAADYPPGRLELAAATSPSVPGRRPGASPLLVVSILPPRPIQLWLFVIPAAITACFLLALLAHRLWPAIRRRLRRDARPPAALPGEKAAPVFSGVRLARTGLRSLMRQSFDLHGVTWDPVDDTPLSGVSLRLLDAGGQEVARVFSDDGGRFIVSHLPPGELLVIAVKSGYVHESFRATLPHRGSLHNLRLDLVQVRVRLLEIYQQTTASLLPSPAHWARWTPREIARHAGAGSGRRLPRLEALTRLLEEAYWSRDPAEEPLLQRAGALAREGP